MSALHRGRPDVVDLVPLYEGVDGREYPEELLLDGDEGEFDPDERLLDGDEGEYDPEELLLDGVEGEYDPEERGAEYDRVGVLDPNELFVRDGALGVEVRGVFAPDEPLEPEREGVYERGVFVPEEPERDGE